MNKHSGETYNDESYDEDEGNNVARGSHIGSILQKGKYPSSSPMKGFRESYRTKLNCPYLLQTRSCVRRGQLLQVLACRNTRALQFRE